MYNKSMLRYRKILFKIKPRFNIFMKYLYFVREKEIHGREDEIFGGNICNIYVSAESLK